MAGLARGAIPAVAGIARSIDVAAPIFAPEGILLHALYRPARFEISLRLRIPPQELNLGQENLSQDLETQAFRPTGRAKKCLGATPLSIVAGGHRFGRRGAL